MRPLNLRSIGIGRVFGIPLEIDPTWLVVFVLVVASLSFSYFPAAFPNRGPVVDVLSGIVTALLFFASIIAHELSHSLVARAGGIRVQRVTLFVFGGVAQMSEEPHGPGAEFLMAIAGPGMSLLLSALFGVGSLWLRVLHVSDLWWAPLEYLALINLSLAIFNLLPGFPLDGGRVLRSLLWAMTGDLLKATRWASGAGQVVGWGLVTAALVGILRGSLELVWLGLVGWFIASIARASYREQAVRSGMHRVRVGDIMTPSPVTVPGEISVNRFVHEYLLAGDHTRYPVMLDGRIIGLVTLDDVKRLPNGVWETTRVADITNADINSLVVPADDPSDVLLDRFSAVPAGALLVAHDGRLVGIVTRADVMHRTAGA